MWCTHCQLDVPALAVPEEPGVVRCAFCRSELASGKSQEAEARGQEPEARRQKPESSQAEPQAEEFVPRLTIAPPPPIEDWQTEADLRHVERLLGVLRQTDERERPSPIAPFHSPLNETQAAAQAPAAAPERATSSTGLAAWSCLTLGLMAFVCGGVLVIWSFAADRSDLWSLGLPLTLAGQVGLVLGLLLQLDGLSQSTRRTEQTLTDLDQQLGHLRGVTALVSSTHSGPAHSFYAHLTEGASPQILLADLKGQLDLLAQQMARQRKAA